MKRFALTRLPVLADASKANATSPATHLLRAGGIDLLDRLKEGLDAPTHLVELRALADEYSVRMKGINPLEGGGVSIGALTTLAQVAEATEAEMPGAFAALQQSAGAAANPGIRNAATVGGNLLQRPRCWYYRDKEIQCLKKGGTRCYAIDGENRYHAVLGGGPAYIVHPSSLGSPLQALNATVVIAAADGKEHEMPLADLFHLPTTDPQTEHTLAPGEVLLEVRLPAPAAAQRSSYQVAKERAVYDWPLAEVSVSLTLEGGLMKDVRVALGHVAPIPWDASNAARLLEGKKPDEALFAQAAKTAFSKAMPLRDNAYKVRLGGGLLRKALHQATSLPLPE
jgi:xanthine dehydrogenase YagS FAD-binding subunit